MQTGILTARSFAKMCQEVLDLFSTVKKTHCHECVFDETSVQVVSEQLFIKAAWRGFGSDIAVGALQERMGSLLNEKGQHCFSKAVREIELSQAGVKQRAVQMHSAAAMFGRSHGIGNVKH
jgi:hypothetical protein